MGSTGTHREPGMSDREFFEKEMLFDDYMRIVACASMPSGGNWNRVFYAAVENSENAPYAPGQTWALVILMHTSRTRGEYWNFHYKTLSEESGPVESTCPDRILDLLSPTDHEYANEWRESCRAHNARVANARKLAPGQIVRFASPLFFGDEYGEVQRFRYQKEGRKAVFVALSESNYSLFRAHITRWKERAFEIENA